MVAATPGLVSAAATKPPYTTRLTTSIRPYSLRSRGETSWRGDVPAGACGVGMEKLQFVKGDGGCGRSALVQRHVNYCKKLRLDSAPCEPDLTVDPKRRKERPQAEG